MPMLRVDGHDAYAYTGGKPLDPALPAVVFIHGAEHDHSVWNLQSRYFAHHGFAVLAPDLPGHGRSAGAALGSIGAIADWITALLEAAGFHAAALVGHSMGSLAALECAARYPERITRIALLGTAVPMPVSKGLLDAAKNDEPRAMGMINVWSHSARGQIGGNAVPGSWIYRANVRLMERQAPGVLFNDLNACNEYTTGLEAAGRVQCPALVLSGERDMMTSPKSARGLAKLLRNATEVVLPGAGHNMTAEAPGGALDSLVAFLRSS